MTTLTYLGHACFLVETDKAAVLIDPWLSARGAFLGAWRQLPPNDGKLGWLLEKMKQKPVLVYVTHEHEDHFDEETLQKILPLAQQFCIPNYESSYFKTRVAAKLGATPQLVDENVSQQFHDIEFKIFIDESGINRDSAIFVKTADFSFFDGNDCKIFDRAEWLKQQCGHIDILSSQFSGANMHPICYDISKDDYKKISRQKKMRKFLAAKNFIQDLAPTYYMPSAGPAIFPYPEHYHLNFEVETIFPKWWEFETYLAEKEALVGFVALDVGGTATTGANGISFADKAVPLGEKELNDIIQYYRDKDKSLPPAEHVSHAEALTFFEAEMQAKVDVLRANPETPLSCTVNFVVTDDAGAKHNYVIDAANNTFAKKTAPQFTPPYYLHQTSTAALRRLMQSGRGWGTYFLSFLFRNRRDPDVFDSVLSTFFVANDTDELQYGLGKLSQFRSNDERVVLTAEDGKSSVSCKRYCPHQGADLKYAKFDGRYVICPRHQWRFDCEQGGKADNSADTLNAEIIPVKKENNG